MRYISLLLVGLLFQIVLYGQYTYQTPLPEHPVPGKCYVRYVLPDSTFTEAQKEAIHEIGKNIPFQTLEWDTVQILVMVKEGVKKAAHQKRQDYVSQPISYQLITKQRMIKEAAQKWQQFENHRCLSNDWKKYQVVCLEDLPANYQAYEYEEVITQSLPEGYSKGSELEKNEVWVMPPKFEVMPLQKLKISEKEMLRAMPQTIIATMPHEKERLENAYSPWLEVYSCCSRTIARLSDLKQALKDKGYYQGALDNTYDPELKNAIRQFQQANGLPQEGLNISTLRALGLSR